MASNSTAHDAVLAELKQLRTAIDEIFLASSRPAGGFSNNQTTMTRNIQGLAEAASHFYSSASSTASSTRSIRSNTSINGDFPDSRRERVEHFVDQLQGPSRWSTSSPAPTAKSLAPPRPVHSVPTPAKVGLDEEDFDAEFDRQFLNVLREWASASMKNQDYAQAIEHIKEALKQPNSCREESDQLWIHLACCYIFQGAWQRAVPIVNKLSESHAEVCSLLHALSLGYLLEYHFDDAMAACKKPFKEGRGFAAIILPTGLSTVKHLDCMPPFSTCRATTSARRSFKGSCPLISPMSTLQTRFSTSKASLIFFNPSSEMTCPISMAWLNSTLALLTFTFRT